MGVTNSRNLQIEITARHFKAPKELRNFIEKELRKLSRYFDGVLDYKVILTHESSHEAAEIIAHSKGHHFAATEIGDKMDRAVVLSVETIKGQLNRYKEKLMEKQTS